MIQKTRERHRTIQTRDPLEFDNTIEKILEEVKDFNPETERFFDASVGHCAYIKWTEEHRIPENAADRFKLRGIEYRCAECPYFAISQDKRIKYSECKKGQSTWAENRACPRLYELIEEGKVEMDEDF